MHEKIQKIASKWPKNPFVKFFILSFSSQFSSSTNSQFSFSSSLIFNFKLHILNLNLICRLNRITFTYKSLIADFLIRSMPSYYFYFEIIPCWLFRSLNNDLTKMLANLPVEMILLICEYPEFKDLGQLAWTSNRMIRIIKRYLPMALERNILFYRKKIFLVWAKINFSI